ncbi:MAG: VOC family protein [Armatimonadetes bacterium]|nr:VOC family protein [Armatimonadota bacterium]MBS1702090.1 VOC family protein [Armatimonadota bacterium]MBS1728071.1 VOC family protein [Armatimonadota bacterium]
MNLEGMTTLIEVFDIDRSIEFYRSALGFEVHQQAGNDKGLGWAWLKGNGLDLMLNTMYNPGDAPEAPDATRIKWHRDLTLYIGCSDIDAAYGHLVAVGIKANTPEVAPYGMKQCYFSDPDGYGICLQWPA